MSLPAWMTQALSDSPDSNKPVVSPKAVAKAAAGDAPDWMHEALSDTSTATKPAKEDVPTWMNQALEAPPSGGSSMTNLPTGFKVPGEDCSLFAQRWMAKQGVTLPRTAIEQYRATPMVLNQGQKDYSKLQPGDMLFWDNGHRDAFNTEGKAVMGSDGPSGYVNHVGIYIGNGQMAENNGSGDRKVVNVSSYPYSFMGATRPAGGHKPAASRSATGLAGIKAPATPADSFVHSLIPKASSLADVQPPSHKPITVESTLGFKEGALKGFVPEFSDAALIDALRSGGSTVHSTHGLSIDFSDALKEFARRNSLPLDKASIKLSQMAATGEPSSSETVGGEEYNAQKATNAVLSQQETRARKTFDPNETASHLVFGGLQRAIGGTARTLSGGQAFGAGMTPEQEAEATQLTGKGIGNAVLQAGYLTGAYPLMAAGILTGSADNPEEVVGDIGNVAIAGLLHGAGQLVGNLIKPLINGDLGSYYKAVTDLGLTTEQAQAIHDAVGVRKLAGGDMSQMTDIARKVLDIAPDNFGRALQAMNPALSEAAAKQTIQKFAAGEDVGLKLGKPAETPATSPAIPAAKTGTIGAAEPKPAAESVPNEGPFHTPVSEPTVEPNAVETPPQAPQVATPEGTGVSRASRSVMADVLGTEKPTTIHGDTHETLYENGKQAIENGTDPDSIIRTLSENGQPASDAQIGLFAAHRDNLIAALKKLNGRLDAADLTEVDRVKAMMEKNDLMDHIKTFDQHLDEVKAANGRSLSAFRIGQTVNWGDLVEVEIEARRIAPTITELPKTMAADVEAIAARDATIAEREAELEAERSRATAETALRKAQAEEHAQAAAAHEQEVAGLKKQLEERPTTEEPSKTGASKRRTYTKADAQAEIQKILDERTAELKQANVAGSASNVIGQHVLAHTKAAIKVAHVYMKLGASSIEDVVTQTLSHFQDLPEGERPSRQDIIDGIAAKGESRTKSELEMQIATLKAEARRNSTEALTRKAERAAAADVTKAARAKESAALARTRQAEKLAAQIEDSVEKAKAKSKAEQARAADRAATLERKAAERVERRQVWEENNKAKRVEKQKAANELRQAKAKERDLKRRAEEAAKREQETTDAVATAKARTAKEEFWKAAKVHDAVVKEKTRLAEKAFGEQWKYQDTVFKTENDIADLRQQIEEGRYRNPSKREIEITDELKNLRAEKSVLTNKVRTHLDSMAQPLLKKVLRGGASIIRGVTLGTDLGALTRQGMFSWSRPRAALRGVVAGSKALLSDVNLAKIETDLAEKKINGRFVAPIRREAGLSLTDSMSHPEELVFGRLLGKIPVVGKLVGKPLERAQLAFINTARAETFDAGVAAGFSKTELQSRARFINAATGRGNVSRVPVLLEAIMTSPRYEASRWQTLFEPIRATYDVGKSAVTGEGLNRGAAANLQDMAVTAGAAYSLFKMAELAGYKVNWNPTSSDFLKMRRGKEVWDISAGLAPRLRDIFRLFTAVVHPSYQHTVGDVLKGAIVRTASPAVRIPVEQGSYAYQRATGQQPKSPFSGTEPSPGDEGLVTLTPLIFQSTKQAYDAEGPTAAFEAFLKELVGSGYNRYPASGPGIAPEPHKKPFGVPTLAPPKLRSIVRR